MERVGDNAVVGRNEDTKIDDDDDLVDVDCNFTEAGQVPYSTVEAYQMKGKDTLDERNSMSLPSSLSLSLSYFVRISQ